MSFLNPIVWLVNLIAPAIDEAIASINDPYEDMED